MFERVRLGRVVQGDIAGPQLCGPLEHVSGATDPGQSHCGGVGGTEGGGERRVGRDDRRRDEDFGDTRVPLFGIVERVVLRPVVPIVAHGAPESSAVESIVVV